MAKVKDLNELCQMSESELTEIIENSKNAKLIYEFMNKTVKNELNLFDKELDFEDINEFLEADKKSKNMDVVSLTGKGKSTKKGVVKAAGNNLKKKSSAKRLK